MLEIQDLDGQCHIDTIGVTCDEVDKIIDLMFRVINKAATIAERPIGKSFYQRISFKIQT